jgi:hypothetical protein
MFTLSTITTEAKSYSDRIDKSRNGMGYAHVRASFVAACIVADGYVGEDGTTVMPSENEAWALLGITRSVGQRALKGARIAAIAGYTLESLAALRQGSAEYVAAAGLFVRANRQGEARVTEDQWTACEAEAPESLVEAVAILDGLVDAVAEERKAEAAEKAEERKAEKAEREEAEKAAATPAGKVAALVALAANLTTIAHVGGLTEEEWAMVVTVGQSLAGLPFVEAPEAEAEAA